VRTLAEGRSPKEIRERLVGAAPEAYRERLARSELRMLDLGARVVHEWFEEKKA
jgi:hypothetical protein